MLRSFKFLKLNPPNHFKDKTNKNTYIDSNN